MAKENNIFKQENTLVGGIVPQPLADILSLYCLYSKQSRSKVIADLLEIKLFKYSQEQFISCMVKEIGEDLSKKLTGMVVSKQLACIFKARSELERKKINPKHVEQILTEARLFHAKNKDQETK